MRVYFLAEINATSLLSVSGIPQKYNYNDVVLTDHLLGDQWKHQSLQRKACRKLCCLYAELHSIYSSRLPENLFSSSIPAVAFTIPPSFGGQYGCRDEVLPPISLITKPVILSSLPWLYKSQEWSLYFPHN